MKIPRSLLIPVACILGTVIAHAEPQASAKKKVVFIAGIPSHGPGAHEHRAGCMLLADHLNKSGLPLETTVVTNGWPADESVFVGASAIVFYADGGGGHPAFKNLDKLKSFAKNGVGIGCIHYAVEITNGPAGDTFLDLIGGFFETDWSVNPHWHASFKLPQHAVTRGIADFDTTDEWYYHLRFRDKMEGVTPILTDLPPPESLSRPDGHHSGNPAVRAAILERKEPQHVMWVYERPAAFGTGRSFGFTGGHFHKGWQNDSQRRLILNSIAWLANLEVPQAGITSKTPTDEEMQANLDEKKK